MSTGNSTTDIPQASVDLKPPIQSSVHTLHDDFQSGDIVLSTEDGVKFQTHSFILRLCSSIFDSMFAAAAPIEARSTTTNTSARDTLAHELRTIHLDDKSDDVLVALQIMTGKQFDTAVFESLPRIQSLIRFADKYLLTGMMTVIRSSVVRHKLLQFHALEMYVIACNHGWTDVIQATILPCLSHDLSTAESFEALRGVSFPEFVKLIRLVRRRSDKFEEMLSDPGHFYGSEPNFKCRMCHLPLVDRTWKVVRLELRLLLDKCSRGDTIRSVGMTQSNPHWLDLVGASHCGERLYVEEGTRSRILEVLENLPLDL